MSYRDLRNFTEMMRALGYPRLISMENFRTPNFPLVAEILIWLVKRFDPNADIVNGISNEDDRVLLIRSAAHLLVLKANLKLNTKKLYQADGYAVRELLKVTSLLYDALKVKESKSMDQNEVPEVSHIEISMKVEDLKSNRFLVGEITTKGVSLYDLLGSETDLREIRNTRAARHLEMTQVEAAVKDSIKLVEKEIANVKYLMESVSANEATLDSKIEKKRADLQRHQKRLQTLRKVRPAFMEEFEKLEDELKILYSDYVMKYRNLSYLEYILEQSEQAEQKRINQKQDTTRKILEEIRQDEMSVKSSEMFHDGLENDMKAKSDEVVSRPERAKNRTAAKGAGRRVFGSMTGGNDDSDSLDDSDSDLLLDGDITEDDDGELDKKQIKNLSDDDF